MMKSRPPTRPAAALLAGVIAGALASAAPVAAQAQAAADAWRWDGSVYFWFPAVGGQSTFPADGTSVDVSTGDVIDALKVALMGNLGVKQGVWGAWTDLVYADFGATQEGTRDFTIGNRPLPGSLSGRLGLDLKATAWTLAGTYELLSAPAHQVDLLGGVRMVDLHTKLSWSLTGDIAGTGLTGREGASSVSLRNWDAVIGVKGRAYLDGARRWFLPYHLDVGTGESDLTWQANAGVGYRFDWGSVAATYRHLDYEMKSGQAIQSFNLSGLVVGLAFQW
jgi:hypothetical protein